MPGRESRNGYILMAEIVKLSQADTWPMARAEWQVDYIEMLEEDEDLLACLCTHYPIREICHIINTHNGNEATVGNVCVTRFMGIDSDIIFRCIARISKDPGKAVNMETAGYARRRGLINDWEYKFCLSTTNKREPSYNQHQCRVIINNKIVQGVKAVGL